ncbi:cyclic nucleotide-binding domain-containing protein [Spirochaetia bacterium 38H-sp]|uniref:Cyclic nucleotide-binding domain-containing protein n=1 Tax=Rarispira pelagica TaxID=3141764 RepID=A0ABU9U9N2_9SPIR
MSNPLLEKYGKIFPAGTIIFREGDSGDNMFIIQQGKVKISKNISGKEHTLAVLDKGDFFGEMAIVIRAPRSATAMAMTDVLVLSFTREGFQSMVEKNSKIALTIIDRLCRRLQQTNMQLQHLVKNNLKSLIMLDLYFAFKGSDGILKSIPYKSTVNEIALNKEVDTEEVVNIIKEFMEEGLFSIEGDELLLLDFKKLASIVDNQNIK